MINEIQKQNNNLSGGNPHLKQVKDNLITMLSEKAAALPDDFNQTRFMQNCMTILIDIKDIQKCDPLSIARTMLKGAFLDLDFFNRECYAIAYAGKIQFQTDYKGERKIVKKYSINPISDIYTKLVRQGDEFSEGIKDGRQTINFNPKPFNDADIIGAFAVVLFKDGSMMFESMSKAEINKTKTDYSKQSTGQAWIKSWGEMAKKTVSRRLCKHIEIDLGSIEQNNTWNESSDMEIDKKEPVKIVQATSSLDSKLIETNEVN